jgi:hypothetical protein
MLFHLALAVQHCLNAPPLSGVPSQVVRARRRSITRIILSGILRSAEGGIHELSAQLFILTTELSDFLCSWSVG